MKNAIALVVALLLIFATIPAFAYNEHTSGLFTYDLKKNGTAIISDYDWNNNEGDVYVPGAIDGYTVVEIGEYAFACDGKETDYSRVTVILPESIISIRDFAFSNSRIKSINIPNNVQEIGKGAFAKGPYAHWHIQNNDIDNIQFRLSGDHPHFAVIDGALYNKDKKELLYLGDVISEGFTYKGISAIPDGITSIGDYACYRTHMLPTFTLPSTITHIGEYAFAGATNDIYGNRFSITIPHSVTSIGPHAFESLNYVKFGSTSISDIPDYALYHVSNIYIENPEKIKSLGINTYFGNAIKNSSQLSPKITTIPTGFGYNKELKDLPLTVTAIDSMAFTEEVSDFKLSKELTNIAEDAFPAGSTFIVESGSYAERWASENGFAYTVEGQNNLDWLNN